MLDELTVFCPFQPSFIFVVKARSFIHRVGTNHTLLENINKITNSAIYPTYNSDDEDR